MLTENNKQRSFSTVPHFVIYPFLLQSNDRFSKMAENKEEKEGEQTSLIHLTIKTAKEKETIEVNENASVKELKKLVADRFKTDEDLVCLIFAGKILKDNENLENHKIKDGLTVHLVIRSKKPPPDQSSSTSTPSATSQSSANVGATTDSNVGGSPFGFSPFGNLGLGGNLAEMQQSVQREMMSNPEFMRQMMENPLVQNLMSNPEYVRTMLTSSPQMQSLMERNPEISHMLNNPDILRQTMEMVRNPAALQELMRTQDRALSNLESLPGGYNALRRMYTEVQEPMLNAAQEQFGSNPFASTTNEDGNRSNEQRGQEVRDPLPNPWAPRQTPSTPSSGTRPQQPTPGTQPSDANALQGVMQQLMTNPDVMHNMLSSPYIQNMMQSLSQNPDLMQQIVANNPLLAGNPNLQEQMRTMMPQMLQQMQNPEMQSLLTNPDALQAILQIQRGMDQLQRVAPNIVSGMSSAGVQNISPTTGTGNTTSTPTTTTNPSQTTGIGNPNISALSQLMAQMLSGTQQQQVAPEERYRSQLEQLIGMGFTNRERNLRALIASFGDINGAIERLLQSPE
ncbi:ubiquilin 1:2-like protein [Leptotrombidium deliense]|uniref:Ubiquilin n=1 Tax=Leptotrombidium deliense TaxID=299467 RepID=A0A443SE61_9ACAR|nr:ubiquilin 1:2-like protein [Leptotrombidium deliense]